MAPYRDSDVRIPNFILPDHRGGEFTLSAALASAAPLVVVFIRGHWCPYCRRYLCKLQSHLGRIRDRGARLVVISPEPPHTSSGLAQQLRLTFPILSDEEGRIIEQFGVRNGFASVKSLLPHPAVFILDAGAVIRFRSIDRNYRKRTTIRTILGALDGLGTASTQPAMP